MSKDSDEKDHKIELWNAHKYYIKAKVSVDEAYFRDEMSEFLYKRICTEIMKNVYDSYREGANSVQS